MKSGAIHGKNVLFMQFFTILDAFSLPTRYQVSVFSSAIFFIRSSSNHMVKEVLSLIVSGIWLCKIGYRQEERTEQTPSWKHSFTLTEIMMIT